jgi:polyisoprenoid-binding protein YceI
MKSGVGVLVALSLGLPVCPAQAAYRLEPSTSVMQIQLSMAGALGFLGRRHLIQAPIQQGRFVYDPENPGKSSVELVVDASALQVLDPELSAEGKKSMEAMMQSARVLGVRQYPKIHFKSVQVEAPDRKHLEITGNLTLRSQTHPVRVELTLEQGGQQLKATGKSQFKQSTFGIRPVSAGLGTVRVQDRVTISFEMFGEQNGG